MRLKRLQITEFKSDVFLKYTIFSVLIAISLLIIGVIINIIFVNLMAGESALDQFFKYFGNFFTGNWGDSMSPYVGGDVGFIISHVLPRTIDLLLFPTILGLVIGILLGRLAYKFRNSWIEKLIQFFIVISISMPIYFSGMFLQRIAFDSGWFPSVGYKSSLYEDPEFITGFLILDASISGDFYLVIDYLNHIILPIFCLSIPTIALITMVTHASMSRELHKKSIISNTMITGITFSLIFTFCILVDVIFVFYGFGFFIIDAIWVQDYNLLRASLFIIIILFVIITFISNIIFSIIKSTTISWKNQIKNKSPSTDNNNNLTDINNINYDEKPDKLETNTTTKKPFQIVSRILYIIISLIIVIYIIIIASFPQLISGFSINEANGIYPGSWEPPSEDHLLGTIQFGRDVFARVLFGARDALVFSLGAILIGLLGGLPLGFISSVQKNLYKAVELIIVVLFIIPTILLIPIIGMITGNVYFTLISWIGIALVPVFALIIANYPFKKRNIIISLKKVMIYIPLLLSFVILIYVSLGFLGFGVLGIINWGTDIAEARVHLYDAPWASIWPGFFLFLTLIGFFLLHFGLKNVFADNIDSTRFSEMKLNEEK